MLPSIPPPLSRKRERSEELPLQEADCSRNCTKRIALGREHSAPLTPLPAELFSNLLQFLSLKEVSLSTVVNRSWRHQILNDEEIWRDLFLRHYNYRSESPPTLQKVQQTIKRAHENQLCTRAFVDREESAYMPNSWIDFLLELPDEKLVSVGFHIKIWDLKTDQCLQTIEQDPYYSNSCFTQLPNGLLASASRSCTIKIWDVENSEQPIQILDTNNERLGSLLKLSNGQLLSTSQVGIKVWDLAEGRSIQTLVDAHLSHLVNPIQLSSGEIASISQESRIKIWSLETGRAIRTLRGNEETVLGIIEISNGRIASKLKNDSIIIWNIEQMDPIQILRGHRDPISTFIELSNGEILSASYRTIKRWNPETGECLQTLEKSHVNVIFLLELSESQLLSGSSNGTLTTWNLKTGESTEIVGKQPGYTISFRQLSTGEIVSGSSYGEIKTWIIPKV